MEELLKNDCDLHGMNIMEMTEINGGNPWLIFIAGAILGGLVYDVVKYAATESNQALLERASEDDYIPYADVGHR